MNAPTTRRLTDGRLLLQHGPIDLVIFAVGPTNDVSRAYDAATETLPSILLALVEELPRLRQPIAARCRFAGPVAQEMAEAIAPFRGTFLTPMAAVAGAVADHMLRIMAANANLRRAYVNNGGDLAIHLAEGETLSLGLVANPTSTALFGRAEITSTDPVRGVATSGWRGRSFSRGIADSVTVLARNAALADAAATLIANDVDVDDPAVSRRPAASIDPDSDLAGRLVTVDVGALSAAAQQAALATGRQTAEAFCKAGHIEAAAITLGEGRVIVGERGRFLAA